MFKFLVIHFVITKSIFKDLSTRIEHYTNLSDTPTATRIKNTFIKSTL